jgi:hypothetical protein
MIASPPEIWSGLEHPYRAFHMRFRIPRWLLVVMLVVAITRTSSSSESITSGPAVQSSTGFGFSAAGEISSDGRYVLFESTASDLVAGGTAGGFINLFVRDRQSGKTELISENLGVSGGGNASSTDGSFSADLRWIVFSSAADNLAPGDNDKVVDIFLRDRVDKITTRVSAPYAPLQGRRRASSNPSISADGSRIAFESTAQDIAPMEPLRIPLFYLYDRAVGTNRVIPSQPLGSNYTTNTTTNVFISKAGNIVLFEAIAADLSTLWQARLCV